MTPGSKIMSILLIIFFTGGLVWFLATLFSKPALPILGEPGHTAGQFSFTNQLGKPVTEKDAEGKVTVAAYFFTHCVGICPVMNKNLDKVYETYKDRKDFTILSHTVDPERDTVAVMARYAERFKAVAPSWQFLTGEKHDLYKAAREDYLLAVVDSVPPNLEDDFIHTEYVTLLDKERRIRGFYNATDSVSVVKMIDDIKQLLK